jgi:hypothetical protein
VIAVQFNRDVGLSEDEFLDFLTFVNSGITVKLTLWSSPFKDAVHNFVMDLNSQIRYRLDFNVSFEEMKSMYRYDLVVHGTRTKDEYVSKRFSSLLSRLGKY